MRFPKFCYSTHPAGEPNIKIVTGEKGYYPAPYVEDVEEENKKLGIESQEIVDAMVEGSMFGWEIHGFKECPRCKETKLFPEEARNALSRRDNKTYICSDCGTREAIEDLKGGISNDLQRHDK
jgi:predicted RNA-binding Zn-ribbon protein involved in translation (DUF1610 family)